MSPAELRDHWAETAHLWRPGMPVITWHVIFDPDSALHELAARLAPVLAMDGLDLVPPRWLHLTTQGVGLAPDVPDEETRRIVSEAAARLADLAPLRLSLGPATLGAHGVALWAAPLEPLVALRDRLQDSDAAVRGQAAVPDWRAGFRPHVSLAYAGALVDPGDLAARLSALAGATTAALIVRQVSLLLLSRGDRLYHWEELATVPLGGVTP
jgi:2'-5' RNA ligase